MAFDPKKFGAFIKRYRTAEGLTVAAVQERGKEFLKHSSNVTNVELGNINSPDVKTIHGIAVGLGVQTSYLFEKMGYGDQDFRRLKGFRTFERREMARALSEYIARHPENAPLLADLLTELNDLELTRDESVQRAQAELS